MKCKVLAPKQLYVISSCFTSKNKSRYYEKLIFTSCKTCAEKRNQKNCPHDNNERYFIGTWTTDKVKKGYKILKVYEVWHFDKTNDDLFKGYIQRFMKVKLESSKYEFKTKDEERIFKSKIKKSLDIDIDKFEYNAGLRSIAKICLCSLWEKFGQRSNMNQIKYITEPSEFYKILLDDTMNNLNIQFINNEMVQMTYTFKDHFIDNSNNTNIYIVCFTTNHARLLLYDNLDYL